MATLPMPDRDALSPKARDLYDRLAARRGRIDGMYRALLNHPALAGRVSDLGTYLRFGSSALPGDMRELVILWAARQCRAGYEWIKHAAVARRVGLPEPVIEAIRQGGRPIGLSPAQEGALDAAEAVLALQSVPQAAQDALIAAVGIEGLIEVVVLCGFYRMIAGVVFAFDVPLPDAAAQPF